MLIVPGPIKLMDASANCQRNGVMAIFISDLSFPTLWGSSMKKPERQIWVLVHIQDLQLSYHEGNIETSQVCKTKRKICWAGELCLFGRLSLYAAKSTLFALVHLNPKLRQFGGDVPALLLHRLK